MRTLEEYRQLINTALDEALQPDEKVPPRLVEAMRYTVFAGGKRLRPILLLAACEAGGGDVADALPYAVALEAIHNYSLIHDDLPAMDNDDTRHGQPSSHIAFGEAMAILAGDGLLSFAMEHMLQAALTRQDSLGMRAAERLATRCGVSGMVAGQVLDMAGDVTDLNTIRAIYEGKTSALFMGAMEAGLILAGCPADVVALGAEYGLRLGLAFQIVDDLLDVLGDEQTLGKQVGQDAANGKMTWVTYRGLDAAQTDAQKEAQLAARAIESALGANAGFFTELVMALTQRVC